jgi:hypothetical protein
VVEKIIQPSFDQSITMKIFIGAWLNYSQPKANALVATPSMKRPIFQKKKTL